MSDYQYSEQLEPLFELSTSLADPYELELNDFVAMGITTEHIPELTHLILDEKYYLGEDEDLGYPHLFAYQALGQLKTEAAINALVQATRLWSDSDWFEWFTEAMPELFSKIGGSAIAALVKLLQDVTVNVEARVSAVNYLEAIGTAHAECRDLCVEALIEQLRQCKKNHPTLNGFIITALAADFKAVESAALIKTAFDADVVDESIMGDWDDAQVYLGLKTREELPPQERKWFWERPKLRREPKGFAELSTPELNEMVGAFGGFRASPSENYNPQKAKAKRQQQKKARRTNRHKK